jgi:hypothetical protein
MPPLRRRRHLRQAARRLSSPLLARELRGVFGMDPGARRGRGDRVRDAGRRAPAPDRQGQAGSVGFSKRSAGCADADRAGRRTSAGAP